MTLIAERYIKSLTEILPKWRQRILEKFFAKKETEYISMPRHLDEKDDRVSCQQLSEALDKLSKAGVRAAAAMFGISKSLMHMTRTVKAYCEILSEEYGKTHPRVVHLAKHAKKARVRKKNINRIRRMKWCPLEEANDTDKER